MKAATPHFLLAPNRPAAITPTAIRAAAVTPGPDILKSPPRARCARHRRPPHTAAQDSNRLEFSGPRLRYDHRGAHFSHLRFSDVRLVRSLSEAANHVAPEALTLLPLQACSCALTRVSRRAAPVPCLRAAASFPRLPLPLPLPLMPLTRPHPSPPLNLARTHHSLTDSSFFVACHPARACLRAWFGLCWRLGSGTSTI